LFFLAAILLIAFALPKEALRVLPTADDEDVVIGVNRA